MRLLSDVAISGILAGEDVNLAPLMTRALFSQKMA